ncbi:MAG: hypothetical protein WCI52_03565 [bacterium]
MIEPLSRTKRFIYLVVFIILFLILIPVVVLYSTGYTISSNFTLEKTGGVYVYSTEPNVSIFINGKLERQTNSFQKGFFASDLTPKQYVIKVQKDKFSDWNKTIIVLPQQVSEAYPFLIPNQVDMATITPRIADSSGVTTTNPVYTAIATLFDPLKIVTTHISTSTIATTSPEALAVPHQKVKVWKEKDSIFAEWTGDPSDTPFYFCSQPVLLKTGDQATSTCSTKILVYKAANLGTVDFYPGRNDVILFGTKDGIYVTELDMRPNQNIVTLLSGQGYDFRVSDGEQVFIKTSKGYFQASL